MRQEIMWLFGPKSKFRVNDSVQLRDGDNNIMVVTEIDAKFRKDPVISCKWIDPVSGLTKGTFLEDQLEPFDWERAYRDNP